MAKRVKITGEPTVAMIDGKRVKILRQLGSRAHSAMERLISAHKRAARRLRPDEER